MPATEDLRYLSNDIYKSIALRFFDFHRISLREHIGEMLSISTRTEEGFDFVSTDISAWTAALIGARFQEDVRYKIAGILPSIGGWASMATHGRGFRENSWPSLHCAVAGDKCNIHLDNTPPRLGNYDPDLGEHIVDELLWQTDLVPVLGITPELTDLLHRLHPIVPNSGQFKPYSEVGVELELYGWRSPNLQQSVRITIGVTHTCSNITCDLFSGFDSDTAENKKTLNLTWRGW